MNNFPYALYKVSDRQYTYYRSSTSGEGCVCYSLDEPLKQLNQQRFGYQPCSLTIFPPGRSYFSVANLNVRFY